jgi:uncharacterized repeat protein (TIGR01451 family)
MQSLAAMMQLEIPRWWRLALIAAATVILCSCRTPLITPHSGTGVPPAANSAVTGETPVPLHGQVSQQPYRAALEPTPQVLRAAHYGAPSPALPSGAFQPAIPAAAVPSCPCCSHGGACHHGVADYAGPSASGARYPGIPQDSSLAAGSELTPGDEWLCDGGDQEREVKVAGDFAVYGMDPEDTVAHFDTLDGRRLVQPSNKVCVYSPRFAAVRQVRGLNQHEQHQLVGNIHKPVHLNLNRESQLPVAYNQPVQPIGQIGVKRTSTFRERTAGVYADNLESILAFQDRISLALPMQIMETSLLDQAEKARLSAAIDAAITWSHDHAVAVHVGQQGLVIDTHDTKLGEVIMFEHEGTPKLQIVKLASTQAAEPGDEVEFALWFDNIGDEPIGNVTIIDNLTTRLEYIDGSQSCTLEADFFTEANEAESFALRWEIIKPIPAGKGGICRFKCRVR